MVDLPRTPLDNSVTQGSQSSVSGGEIRSAFGVIAESLDAAGETFEAAEIEKAGLEGQGAVYKDEKGVLKYDAHNPLSRAGRAFNRSAQQAYVSQISMDARPAVANLEAEAKGNVGEFDKLSRAYVKDMLLRNKDPLLKGAIQSELTGLITSSRTGMIRAQQQRDLQSQSDSITARIKMANEDAAALARTGGTGTAEYAEQLDIIKTLEKEKVGNPLFAYSQEESDVFLRGVEGSHVAESIVGQVESIYQSKGLKAAQDFAEKSFDDPNLQLSPSERGKYKNAALGALKQFKDEVKIQRDENREVERGMLEDMAIGPVPDEEVFELQKKLQDSGDPIRAIRLGRKNELAKQKLWFDPASDEKQIATLARVKSGNTDTASLIKQFEGFRANPYFDVNANRIGYGSDTITKADGSVVKVEPGMRVSRADADRDLNRRIGEFQTAARDKVGGKEWDGLGGATQAALTSIAYNYGSLPDRLVTAVRSGDRESIASAVEGLAGDNNGVNAGRRAQEASIIRGGLGLGVDAKLYASMNAEVGKDIDAQWDNMKSGLMKGDTLAPDDIYQLGHALAVLGDTDRFDKVEGFLKQTADYSALDLAHMRAAKAEVEKDGTAANERDAYDMMNAVYEKTVKGLKDDPLAMASTRGIVPPLEPLDMSNPVAMATGLGTRQAMVKQTERNYGVDAVPALTADEITSLSKTLATAPVEQRAQLLSTLNQSLNDKTYMATMAKIGDKSAPAMAIAGGLYARNPDVAESVMRGVELLKATPGLVPKESDDKYLAGLALVLPYQAFAPGMDMARNSFIEAARGRYADLSAQSGDASGTFSDARMQQAINDVTGGLVTFNRQTIFPPRHGMTQPEFDGMMGRLKPSDVEGAIVASGDPVSVETIRDSGNLRAIGEGRYLVQLGGRSASGFQTDALPYVMTTTGQPLVLDLTPQALHWRDVERGLPPPPEKQSLESSFIASPGFGGPGLGGP